MIEYLKVIESIAKTETAANLTKGIVQLAALGLVAFMMLTLSSEMKEMTVTVRGLGEKMVMMGERTLDKMDLLHEQLIACLVDKEKKL